MNNELIAGVDEAGRGSFLGKVYAGCVIWDNNIEHAWLKDSKTLSKKQRTYMRDFIIENCVAWSIGYSDNNFVDDHGIVRATMNAMHNSIKNLNIRLDHLYIDGNFYKPFDDTMYTCFIKGDSLYKCISAASILAKTFHDDDINDLCTQNPELNQKYDLSFNMGYGTQKHIQGLKIYKSSIYHRQSFIKKYI
jgi:ribonuclease HII